MSNDTITIKPLETLQIPAGWDSDPQSSQLENVRCCEWAEQTVTLFGSYWRDRLIAAWYELDAVVVASWPNYRLNPSGAVHALRGQPTTFRKSLGPEHLAKLKSSKQ
jgi:hypothetical protein